MDVAKYGVFSLGETSAGKAEEFTDWRVADVWCCGYTEHWAAEYQDGIGRESGSVAVCGLSEPSVNTDYRKASKRCEYASLLYCFFRSYSDCIIAQAVKCKFVAVS
jgi:hypothetical protein